MTVLHFCNLIPDKEGAFEHLLCCNAEEFAAHGDRYVAVFARMPIEPVRQRLKASGAVLETIPEWSEGGGREHPWRFVVPALRLLKRERPDIAVVQFGNELPALALSLLGDISGPRSVKWLWAQDQQVCDPSPVTSRVNRLRVLSWRFDHFLAVYDGGKVSMAKRGVPAERITAISNSIPDHTPTRTPGWLREELGVEPNSLLVVSVAWLVKRKRMDFVMDAFRAASEALQPGPAIHLLVVGDGPERESLRRSAEAAGIASRVNFMGLRNDVRDIVADCDLLLHASRAETCTFVITEAMCASVPSVVTFAGAAREQIEDGVSGYVLDPEDRDGFVARVAELLGDGERRAAFGRAARERWSARYRVELAAKKYYEMYRGLAGGSRLSSRAQRSGVEGSRELATTPDVLGSSRDPSTPLRCARDDRAGFEATGRMTTTASAPLHVVHVVISLAAGGLERLVVDWTSARNRRCAGSTSVCCLDEEGELAPSVEGRVLCLKAERSRRPFDLGAVKRLRRLLRDAGDVVVHSHNVAAWQYVSLATAGLRVRHVHTEHGTNVYATGWRNRLRNRFLLARTDCLVAVSEDTAHAIAASFGIARERIAVVPNGIDPVPPLARDEARERLGLAGDANVLGSVGRLAEVKGYDRLLPVFAEVTARLEYPWVLVLVGDGPARPELEALTRSRGCEDRVILAGARPDARELMKAFDLFVLPSRSEGLSIALLEAMAASVPVLVTDVGENRLVLDGGRCGTLLPDDEQEWPDALRQALSRAGMSRLAAMAVPAAERVADRYSSSTTLGEYERCYAQGASEP